MVGNGGCEIVGDAAIGEPGCVGSKLIVRRGVMQRIYFARTRQLLPNSDRLSGSFGL
jgi:hypothetical protein